MEQLAGPNRAKEIRESEVSSAEQERASRTLGTETSKRAVARKKEDTAIMLTMEMANAARRTETDRQDFLDFAAVAD